MLFRYWTEGIKFIGLFIFAVIIPCVYLSWIGTKLINQLGIYPSRSAKIQLSIFGHMIGLIAYLAVFLILPFLYLSD